MLKGAFSNNVLTLNKANGDVEITGFSSSGQIEVKNIGIQYTPIPAYTLNVTALGNYNGAQYDIHYMFNNSESDYLIQNGNKLCIIHNTDISSGSSKGINLYASQYISATGPALEYYAMSKEEIPTSCNTCVYWTDGVPRTFRNYLLTEYDPEWNLPAIQAVKVLSTATLIESITNSREEYFVYRVNMPPINETSQTLQPMSSIIAFKEIGVKSCNISLDVDECIISHTKPNVIFLENGFKIISEYPSDTSMYNLEVGFDITQIHTAPTIWTYVTGSNTTPFALTFNDDVDVSKFDYINDRITLRSASNGGYYAQYGLKLCPYKENTVYLIILDSSSNAFRYTLNYIRINNVLLNIQGTYLADNWTSSL